MQLMLMRTQANGAKQISRAVAPRLLEPQYSTNISSGELNLRTSALPATRPMSNSFRRRLQLQASAPGCFTGRYRILLTPAALNTFAYQALGKITLVNYS